MFVSVTGPYLSTPVRGVFLPRFGGAPASAPTVEAVTGGRRKPAAGNSYTGNSYRDAACTHGQCTWLVLMVIHDEKAVQPRGLERGTTGHSLNPSILTRICFRRTPDRLWCAPVMGDIPPQNRVLGGFRTGGLKRKPPHSARRNRTAHTAHAHSAYSAVTHHCGCGGELKPIGETATEVIRRRYRSPRDASRRSPAQHSQSGHRESEWCCPYRP